MKPGIPTLTDLLVLSRQVESKTYECILVISQQAFLTSNNLASTFAAFKITAGGLANFSDLATVFDQYKVNMCEITFQPNLNVIDAVANNAGQMFTVLDFDDATALSSTGAAQSYSSCITTEGYEKQVRTFYPRMALAAYQGALTGFANVESRDTWLDAAYPSIEHYGVKTAWTSTSASNFHYDIYARVHMSFRNQR